MDDSAETRELLQRVRDTSERARISRAQADSDSARRRDAVRDAMDAGVPRQAIADAAGMHRDNLYRLIKN